MDAAGINAQQRPDDKGAAARRDVFIAFRRSRFLPTNFLPTIRRRVSGGALKRLLKDPGMEKLRLRIQATFLD